MEYNPSLDAYGHSAGHVILHPFMEPEPTTGPHTEPDEYSPHSHTYFL